MAKHTVTIPTSTTKATLIVKWRTRGHRSVDERGSVMIMAFAFLVVVSVTLLSLASWTMNDLNNSTHFTNARSQHYSATSVTNVAVNAIRYATLLSNNQAQNVATPLGICWAPAGGLTFSQLTTNGVTMAAWCSTTENLVSARTRVVTVYVCVSALTPTSTTNAIAAAAGGCQMAPYLLVQVTFNDYPPGGGTPLTTQCSTWCGQGITLNSWTWA